jgi:hypothetical protein
VGNGGRRDVSVAVRGIYVTKHKLAREVNAAALPKPQHQPPTKHPSLSYAKV